MKYPAYPISFILICVNLILYSQNQEFKHNKYKKASSYSKATLPDWKADSSFYKRWRFLGPDGMPNILSSSNTYGVGQANRIMFDPFYNGLENTTVYAASFFGGLWRSLDDGDTWHNVNTDFLPSTSIADICINPFDSRMLFVSTGYGDGGIFDARSPNWAHINPLFTVGIFRSIDFGNSWQDISGNFPDFFPSGGMCRKMAINPFNPDQIFVATTEGVIFTNNATKKHVKWKNAFQNIDPELRDTRGIEFKPDDSNTIYASGTGIFRSQDGGKNWKSITGIEFNLDLNNLKDSLIVRRINIAVSPAAPQRLYAYILGERTPAKKSIAGAHIAIFEDEKWEIIETRYSSGLTYFADNWIAIAVSPVDGDAVFYGNSRLIGSEDIKNTPFGLRSPYCGDGFHADIHALAFQPNVENPKLFCGNHGGMSVKSMPNPTTKGWEYKNEGLGVATIWSFDDSEADENIAIIATQDNGTLFRMDTLGSRWHFIAGGDGYSARIDDQNPNLLYNSLGDKSFNIFDLQTFKNHNKTMRLPNDSRSQRERVKTTKTFPLQNHPITSEPWFGFTEIYTKLIDLTKAGGKHEDIWVRQSDLHKTLKLSWMRQITEIAFSESNPEIIYVVTAGQQNSPASDWHLPSGLFKSETGGLMGEESEEIRFQPINYPGYKFDNDTLPIITGIAVSNVNPNHIWIAYTGIPGHYRIWFSPNGGETWINDDPYEIFADNPVNAIAYLNNRADRLYAGTDRGLYTKSRFTGWEKITDFPNVRITELKINYKFNKLRVATFGRGLWEGLVIIK
jgi:hypothetical protein